MAVSMPEKADPNASSSEKPLIKPSYRADIDGLRALAVVAVIAFHAFPDWVSGGFIGVDVFFVISGFVITGMAHREWVATGCFDPIMFLSRRAKRLLPSLFLLLFLILVV